MTVVARRRQRAVALLAALLLPAAATARAQTAAPGHATAGADAPVVAAAAPDAARDLESLEEMTIIGTPEEVSRIPGSAHRIDSETLETYEYDDVHRVLRQVPGVYVRQEEGFGLRPNIGIRGALSERSAKVTLMEDKVLMAPAPYSAPAAYYFPLLTRMVAVEVFKGPASIQYGPNTIGGAINFVSRPVPDELAGALDASAGQYDTYKVHGWVGDRWDLGGFLLEGLHLESDGFKDIDFSSASTGFSKNEVIAKGELAHWFGDELETTLGLELTYADEESDETYLGLTDEDFRRDPYRRYVASEEDRMVWDRWSGELRAAAELADVGRLELIGYRQEFDRAWKKLNRFRGGPPLDELLKDPTTGQGAVYYAVLTGAEDSTTPDQALLVGTNDRAFVSQGVQLLADTTVELALGPIETTQRIEGGVRFHEDEIVRFHTEDAFAMQSRDLVPEGTPTDVLRHERGASDAWSFHLLDRIEWRDLAVAPGVRVELIDNELSDRLTGERVDGSQSVVLPGVGAFYQLTDEVGLLAGLHEGFSPVAPGQPDDVDPEESLNYEAGVRAATSLAAVRLDGEVIGFFNDYDNLVATCTFSAGCDDAEVDRQFNAGEVDVWGVEVVAGATVEPADGLQLPLRVLYTLTESEFQSDFASENPIFGEVERGDELPYVPRHQATFLTGLEGASWGANVSVAYVSEMRDTAGQGPIPAAERTDAFTTVDLRLHWDALSWARLYFGIDNVFDEEAIVSRRPFGARPGKPFQAFGGIRLALP